MTLYLLRYNNYYNRIVKKKDKLSEYMPYVIGNSLNNINFNPNDGIWTEQIINWEYDIPDYILVVDRDNKINSRWYVMECSRTLGGQFKLKLFRDSLVDFYENIMISPAFVEKGPISNEDPFIFNEEGINLNQIKTSETTIRDKSNCAWIVGYMTPDNVENEGAETPWTFNFKRRALIDYTLASISEYETVIGYESGSYKYGRNVFTCQVEAQYNDTSTLYFAFDNYGGKEILSSPGWYGSVVESKNSSSGIYTISTLTNDQRNQILNEYVSSISEGMAGILSTYSGFVSSTLAENAYNEGGKIIYAQDNHKYYKVNTKRTFGNYKSQISVQTEPYQILEDITQNIELLHGAGNASSYQYTIDFYEVTLELEEISDPTIEKEIEIPITRNKLNDAPYCMFAIPYTKAIFDEEGVIKYHNVSKDILLNFAAEMSKALSGVGTLIDIQLLPYSPLSQSRLVYDSGLGTFVSIDGMSNGIDYSYYELSSEDPTPETSGRSDGIMVFWCTSSTFSFDIVYDYIFNPMINPFELKKLLAGEEYPWPNKLWNETYKYRLCSPNYSSAFDFSPAKNGGCDGFNIDCTYRPFNPYIHVAPKFNGLYGADFDDARGLICGGDYSLPQLNDAWQTFERQNVNYEKTFQRQIESLEISHKWQRLGDISNVITGSISAGVSGAAAGGYISGSPMGSAAGAMIGSGLSMIGGGVDAGINEIMRREYINLSKDQFGYNLGNIQALPTTISKVSAFSANNKIFPFIEIYECTREELDAFVYKLVYNGLTTMKIVDQLGLVLINKPSPDDRYNPNGYNYIKARMIRLELGDDYHMAATIADELYKGVYMT